MDLARAAYESLRRIIVVLFNNGVVDDRHTGTDSIIHQKDSCQLDSPQPVIIQSGVKVIF